MSDFAHNTKITPKSQHACAQSWARVPPAQRFGAFAIGAALVREVN
jgi:hypothetical protein